MKIKIIDLLNKIANNKWIPNKIKYHNTEYFVHTNVFGEFMIIDKDNQHMTYNKLNDEVEIIEEKKIPEKLEDYYLDKKGECPIELTIYEQILRDKINDIIDYLKSKGE